MADIEVLYLSSAPSPTQFDALKAALKPNSQSVSYGMAEASFKFHNLLMSGIAANQGVAVTSLVGRSVNPKFHDRRWWSAVSETASPNMTVHHVAVPNFLFAKQTWAASALAARAAKWVRSSRGADLRIALVDGSYVTALPGVLAALAGTDVIRLAFFGDIYSYMAPVSDASQRAGVVHAAMRRFIPRVYDQLDGVVVMTEAMNNVINPSRKPSLLLEGLVDPLMATRTNTPSAKEPIATIVYAGALRREYGLADLIEGFTTLDRDDIRLHIYGGGDFAPDVQAASTRDSRIRFLGYQPLDAVVAAEEAAWLLVNPRPPHNEFTRFSFPSKIMEYMVSGTPVLTTRLPGIPEEYERHLYFVDGVGSSGIAEAISRVMTEPKERLHEMGQSAKAYVLAHKAGEHQAKRFLDFAGAVQARSSRRIGAQVRLR